MENESYDHFVRTCANVRLAELNIAQKTKLFELCELINGNTNRSIEIENMYEQLTGKLLEPRIARYWIHEAMPKQEEHSVIPNWYN